MEEAVALTHELDKKGQYVLASPLHPATTATSVRVRDGKPIVTDGPFAETREVLGGFYIIDADNLDRRLPSPPAIPAPGSAPSKSARSSKFRACRTGEPLP